MKTLLLFAVIAGLLFWGCEKSNETVNLQCDATVVGFDLNCSTCILSLPVDVAGALGVNEKTSSAYYLAVNLGRNDFKIGQSIRIKARNATDAELPACISVYASYNYRNIYVLSYEKTGSAPLNDTLEVSYKQCVLDAATQYTVCLDTVLEDSRCPSGAVCIWAGETIARFKIQDKNNTPVFLTMKEGAVETEDPEYSFSFLKLSPYPSINNHPKLQDYTARVLIRKK